MAIDLYSPCPGGRGKKIQYCCPNHVKELEQIDKYLESEQFAAGLAYVESLEKSRPDCACLDEAKCTFQKLIGLWEEAYETAKRFVEREPKNVVALSEAATTAAFLDKPQEAISRLVDAVENVEGTETPVSVVQAMFTVGATLLENGRYFQAVAVAKQLQAYPVQDPGLERFLYRVLASNEIPLMLREQVFDVEAPADFSKGEEYKQAVHLLSHGQWKRGRDILESLIDLGDQWPGVYRSLGLVELWFANEEKGIEYLERFLAADGVDYETKVDVEQFLLLLKFPSWDDLVSSEFRVYTLEDFDSAQEKLLSSRLLMANSNLRDPAGNDISPKNAFYILDRPLCDKTIDLTLDDVSKNVGFAFAFGRQTTRAARLEVYCETADLAAVEETLKDVLGAIPPCEEQRQYEATATWTTSAARPKFVFRDPTKIAPETLKKLADDAFDSFAAKWFDHSYQVLGNRSPKESVASPEGGRKVDALLRVVVDELPPSLREQAETTFRKLTGTAAPEPIAPPESFASEEESVQYFYRVPIWRWGRLLVEKCDSATLVRLMQIANLVAPTDVKEKFANELIKRPQGDVQYEDRSGAYTILIDAALGRGESQKALDLIAEAGQSAKDVGESDGRWKVLEIITRFRRREIDKVRSLANQVFTEYRDDKEAIQMLQEFFERVNAVATAQLQASELYRNQTGAPSFEGVEPLSDAQETRLNFGVGDVPPAQDQKPSSGLWTPDGGGNASGGSSKLWIPD